MEPLAGIEYYADDLKSRADFITLHANSLINRPSYETRAEVSLDRAEAALLRALQRVRKAKLTYKSLEAA